MGCHRKNIIRSGIRSVLSVVLLASLFSCFRLDAQVADSSRINLGFPVYSQYLQNGMVINPAYTGTREVLSGTLSYRMQWMGTNGSPLLQSLSVHSPMKNDRVALGLTAQFMKYGATRSTSLYGSYAYVLRAGEGDALTAEQVFVETGRRNGGQIEVTSGLSAGDQLVTSGQNRLSSGASAVIDNSVDLGTSE